MSEEIDDRFAERLAVLDEQITSGSAIAAETLIEEPQLSSRLESALDCLQLLKQVWPRQQDTPRPTMPRVFGRYHTVRELGRGGFGIVFLAEDLQLARDVAIKVQRPESVLSPEARMRFLREARSSAPLKHPNLVTVYDSGEEGLWCWIASEVVHGPALNHFLTTQQEQAKLPAIRDALQLVRELSEGVAHAHTQGVLHRDIKPANILLEPRCESPDSLADYRAKLADFGLARSLESETVETCTGARLGTPAYMAPEQVEGHREQIGPATDVYGLGVLLHELLTGRPPFTGESESDVLKQVLLSEPRSLRKARPEISRDLEAVVFKCLEKNPARRYANARALATDLGRLLANEPTEARPITLPHRAFRTIRKHPALCVAITAMLCVGGLLATVNRLAAEKHRALGLRTVLIDTEPSGARVAFVPLDTLTGEPIPGGVVRSNHRSPITQELAPGDYLVVAVADDGRFHEVFRHIPRANSEIPELYRHHYFKELDGNMLRLSNIKLHDRKVTNGMALVKADAASLARDFKAGCRPFYMDCTEMTYGEANSLLQWFGMESAVGGKDGDSYAAVTSYDHATAVAEKLGMRLPFAYEYEAAAARCQPRSPTGKQLVAALKLPGFAPVGIPADDTTDTRLPIIGLRSNVAEWTASRKRPYEDFPITSATHFESRTVRGGNGNVVNRTNVDGMQILDQDTPLMLRRYQTWPGVGFRCVRSARPSFIDPPVTQR
jgi:serine/threonine protein kinase